MHHDHAGLSRLIFHNQTLLPPSAPSYGEVSLAVAELRGRNYSKAAVLAEAAVSKDPQLAAGWLAKTVADVYEATPDDLHKERAMLSLDRALECAPDCHKEIIEFFVAEVLGHYVEVLCMGAEREITRWRNLEGQAGELESKGTEQLGQAARMEDSAGFLQSTGLVTGLTAIFSHRLGVQILSSVATVAAFSEAARIRNEAEHVKEIGKNFQTGGRYLRWATREHQTAAMLYLAGARDLIAVAAQVLRAGGLRRHPLDRLVQEYTSTSQWLKKELPHAAKLKEFKSLLRPAPYRRRNHLWHYFKLMVFTCFGLFILLVVLGAILGHSPKSGRGTIPPASSDRTVATNAIPSTHRPKIDPTKHSTPEVRRATALESDTPYEPATAAILTSAMPAENSYTVTGILKGDTLNVRTGPGANNPVSAHLPNGSEHIQIIGAPVLNGSTPWVQIKFGERTGWVTRPYLRPE